MRKIKAKSSCLPICGAVVISLVLGFAAYQKLFSPTSTISNINYFGALVEVLLFFLLLIFYAYWEIWFVVGGVFSLWGGFAVYSWLHNAPCNCVGSKYVFSTKFALICDALFYLYSLFMVSYLGRNRSKTTLLIGVTPVLVVVGYIVGRLFLY